MKQPLVEIHSANEAGFNYADYVAGPPLLDEVYIKQPCGYVAINIFLGSME